jgi:hypothetical protein
MARLHRVTGITYNMITKAVNEGWLFSKYAVAKRLSDATGGLVSVAELCEPAAGVGAPAPSSERLEAAARRLSEELGISIAVTVAPAVSGNGGPR